MTTITENMTDAEKIDALKAYIMTGSTSRLLAAAMAILAKEADLTSGTNWLEYRALEAAVNDISTIEASHD